MGAFVDDTGVLHPLRVRHLIGRSPGSDLRLDDPRVSAEHGVVWWTGAAWAIRDLGSRNGTSVDGARLDGASTLAGGAVVRVGDRALTLTDAGPPAAFAVDPAGRIEVGSPSLLVLPNPDDPVVALVRTADGWRREGADGPAVSDAVEVGGVVYRLALPEPLPPTVDAADGPARAEVGLRFVVSQDQETVELVLVGGEGDVPLGARSHVETLLHLARARLSDRAQGHAEGEQGWVHLDDLLRDLRITENTLNVHVHRARQQLAEAGVDEAHRVVERRVRSSQLRLGLARLEVGR